MASPRSTLGVAPAPPEANLGVSLRFVLAQGKNESTCSDEMSEAFEVALKNDLAPLWIREIEALALPLPGKTVGGWMRANHGPDLRGGSQPGGLDSHL